MIKKFSEFNELNEGQSNFDKVEGKLQKIWKKELSAIENATLEKFKKILNKELIGNTTSDVWKPIKKILDVKYAYGYEGERMLSVGVELENGSKQIIEYYIGR